MMISRVYCLQEKDHCIDHARIGGFWIIPDRQSQVMEHSHQVGLDQNLALEDPVCEVDLMHPAC